jgi:hypothetical protein
MTLVSILGDFHSSIFPISFKLKEKMTRHIIVYNNAKCDVEKAGHYLEGRKLSRLP